MENWRNKAYGLVRRSEAFFKVDLIYLSRGGFWLSITQVVAMISGLGLSIVFANFFPKESYGNYKYILSVVATLGAFSLTDIGTVVIQSVARGFGNALWQGFYTNLKWSFGILIGGVGFAIYYYLNDNTVLAYSFLLASVALPLTASAGLYNSYLLGKKNFSRNTFYSGIRNIVPAALIATALFITSNLAIIITVYFLTTTLVALFVYLDTTRIYRAENDGRKDPELLSYSAHLSVMNVIGNASTYLDKILIFHYLGAAPLAIYAFAIAPVEQLQSGKKILTTLILPKLSERPFEELQKSAGRKSLLLIGYALGLAGIWILAAPYFYKFLYPQYIDSVFYSQVYSFTLLAVFASVLEQMLVAHKKTKELYINRTIIPLIRIGLFFILLPIYGLMGLIISHIIIRSLSGVICYYFIKHPLKN